MGAYGSEDHGIHPKLSRLQKIGQRRQQEKHELRLAEYLREIAAMTDID